MAEKELQTRLKDIKEKGDEAPEESKREFMQIRQNASNILAQAQNKAGAQLGQLQQIQVAKFRADLKPIVGTRLIREWQGVEHTVTVTQDGFEWQGRPYQSLSAIARAITGSRWNGWIFFGLKDHRRAA